MAKVYSYQASYIRQKVVKNEIQISKHALDQMNERKIWLDDVYEAITNGQEIDFQDFKDGTDVKVIFQEATCEIPNFAVVVAAAYPDVMVVTAFKFKDENKFEYIEADKCWRRIK